MPMLLFYIVSFAIFLFLFTVTWMIYSGSDPNSYEDPAIDLSLEEEDTLWPQSTGNKNNNSNSHQFSSRQLGDYSGTNMPVIRKSDSQLSPQTTTNRTDLITKDSLITKNDRIMNGKTMSSSSSSPSQSSSNSSTLLILSNSSTSASSSSSSSSRASKLSTRNNHQSLHRQNMNDYSPHYQPVWEVSDDSDKEDGNMLAETPRENIYRNNDILREEPAERPIEDLLDHVKLLGLNQAVRKMNDFEILTMIGSKKIRLHQLEKLLDDDQRAVYIRRLWFEQKSGVDVQDIPFENYDYSRVSDACCENVLGYVPIPLGYAGPLSVNGQSTFIPMATTEGCLVASTNRGCQALMTGSGVIAHVYKDGMTRGAVVRFPHVTAAIKFVHWSQKEENFRFMKQKFEETTRYGRLIRVKCAPTGRQVFIRFTAKTGDAMGMNMVSKGSEAVLQLLATQYFPDMTVISLSGNYCADKKASAINWIEGRGKSVSAEAVVPKDSVEKILKTDVDTLVRLAVSKNLVGSAVAGSLGGFNAHSANVVTAVFLATGQDAAQNISSSHCITLLEKDDNDDLLISVTMPSLEIGTIGGGTILPAQAACLQMLGCSGASSNGVPGTNAIRFAEILAGVVLAGELNLLAALATKDLVRSHIKMNRSNLNLKSMMMDAAATKPFNCASFSTQPDLPPALASSSAIIEEKLVTAASTNVPPPPAPPTAAGTVASTPSSTFLQSGAQFTGNLATLTDRSAKGTPLHPETCSKVLT